MSISVQIREVNTGQLLTAQQISSDAGTIQQDKLARNLIKGLTCAYEDIYAAVVDNEKNEAIRKFQLGKQDYD
jgi:hypothetical protein